MARKNASLSISTDAESVNTETQTMDQTSPYEADTAPATSEPETFSVEIKRLGVFVNPLELPEASIRFALAYGIKQLVSDAAAGLKKEHGEQAALDAMRAKLDSLLEGTIGAKAERAPRAPKAKTLESFQHAVAVERIKALAVSKGMTAPTGDKLKGFVAKLIETNEGVRAEAQRRFDAQSQASEGVDDEIMAGLFKG